MENLFYIISFQASGTTLLANLLDQHPEILCLDEPEISKHIVYRRPERLENCETARMVFEFYGVDFSDYQKLVKTYRVGEINEDVFLRRSYRLANHKQASCTGAKEVCDLSIMKYDYVRKLMDFHAWKAKFIFIERDLKGVVSSFLKLGFYPPGKHRLSRFNMWRFARNYLACINYIDSQLSTAETYFLTFEELMDAPDVQLKSIFDFLSVDSSEETIRRILTKPSRGVRQDFNGIIKEKSSDWESRLGKFDIRWLDQLYKRKRKRKHTQLSRKS